jgi:hypothetical protein
VRDDLCFFELLRRHSNRLARYRLPAIEDVGRHRRGRDGSVSIMNIVDIGDVRDVGNVRYVSDVRDIHLAEVIGSVVIPREIWFPRPQWKPSR